MSQHSETFIAYLLKLAEQDKGALAVLRRSLSFEPGAFPSAYPIVEGFVGRDRNDSDPYRKALYLVAGLFALHPLHCEKPLFATAFAELANKRASTSIERRFITLLGAEKENLSNYLRQGVSLLSANGIAFNYVNLLDSVALWFAPYNFERKDRLKQQWARDFYQVYESKTND